MKNKLLILSIILIIATIALFGCAGGESIVKEISIAESPRLTYVKGQEFELGNARLKVVYDNGTEEFISINKHMISSFNPNLVGEQYLNITYMGKTTHITVIVLEENIVNISMETMPSKISYVEEQDLNLSGATVKINYENGEPSILPLTEDMVSGYNSKKIGDQNITVNYKGFHTFFKVNVREKVLMGIELETKPSKNIYFLRETLDVSGGSIRLSYDNNYPVTVKLSDLPKENFVYDFSKESSRAVVKITYNGFETSFAVEVKEKDADSFQILKNTEVKQLINKELDFSGMSIQVNYNNGTNEIFGFPNEEVNIAFAFGYDNLTSGIKKIVFTFPSIERTFIIEVELFDKTAIELIIVQPLEEEIYQDNYVDLKNWKYKIKYDNGEITDERTIMNSMLDDPLNNALFCENSGKKTLSFKLDALKADYTFDVIDKEIIGIEVKNDYNYKQLFGIDLNTDGLMLEITYNDGNKNKNDVYLTPSMVLNYNKNFLGEQNVNIKYSDKFTDEFIIDYKILTIKVASSIEIYQDIVNKTYKLYDNFDLSGLKIQVNFDGAESIIINEIGADFTIICDGFKQDTLQFVKTGNFAIEIKYIGIPEDVDSSVIINVNVTNLLTKIDIVDLDGNVIESFDKIAQGMEIDHTKYRLKKSYQSTEEIVNLTKSMLNYKREDLTVGERQVLLSYGEGGINLTEYYSIVILQKSPLSISILKIPNKTVYSIDFLPLIIDLNGLVLRINYNNATQETIYYSEENKNSFEYTLKELTFSKLKVIVTYYISGVGFNTEFLVTRSSEAISSITYEDGRNFTVANISQNSLAVELSNILLLNLLDDTATIGSISLLISYVSGNTKTATINDLYIANPEKFNISDRYFTLNSSTELKIIEVYYDGASFKMAFYVKPTELTSISYFSMADADRIRVKEGRDIDLSQQKYFLTLNFENNKTMNVPILQTNIAKSNDNPNGYDKINTVAGTRSIELIYFYNGNKYVCSTIIEILEKEMISIDINVAPKIKYVEGDSFTILVDDKNMQKGYGSITINYDNGTVLTKSLQSADINNENSSFNINTINFNSSEFSGNTKNQTIFINYREKGVQKSCTYDIYVSDRKNPIINYYSNNIYNFIYGEVEAPRFDVLGYHNLSDTNPTKGLSVTVTYKNKNDVNAPETSVLPTAVGRYTVIIRYVSNMTDRENNDFIDSSKDIVITAKDIYVKVKDMASIYGQLHSENYIFYASRLPNLSYEVAMLPENNPFAYSDHFDSENFRDLNQVITVMMNYSLSSSLPAGTYKMRPNNCISKNYRILYAESDYVINKREVVILPTSMDYIYGQSNFNIPYKTLQKYENGAYVVNSGLVGQDKLGGALGYGVNSPLNAAIYKIHVGTLNNPNYTIIFNDYLENVKEDYYVNIAPKKIYVKADNISIIYGQQRPNFNIQFFANEICSITEGAFAFNESSSIFGDRNIIFTYDEELNIGKYNVSIKFDTPFIGNYEVIFIDSTIAVSARNVEIEIGEHFKYYGEETPQITFNIINQNENSGLLDGETLKGKIGLYNLNENVASYSYDISDLIAKNPNYNIIYKPTTLFEIKEAEIIVIIDNKYLSKVYDGKVPYINLDNLSFYSKSTESVITDPSIISILKDSIVIDFIGNKKDANKYPVAIENFNFNYKVTLQSSYSYEILPRPVEIIYQVFDDKTNRFVDITELNNFATFRGKAYQFNAIVSPESIMPIYYENGNIVAGQYDSVKATIQRDNYTDANARPYILSAISLNNNNYILPSEGTSCEFKINPYVINVKFLTNEKEMDESGNLKYNVISKEYAMGIEARIDNKDFVITNTIDVPWTIKPALKFYVKHINPDFSGAPVNVEKDGDKYLDHYIVFDEMAFNNGNYTVNIERDIAQETPRYRITPKNVLIYVYNDSLSKRYDGEAPRINQNSYYTNPDIPKETSVQFTFDNKLTESADKDVGEYNLGVICRNANYNITFSEALTYRITELESKLAISNDATAKIYNGDIASVSRNQIKITPEHSGFKMINTYTADEFENAKLSEEKYSLIFNFKLGASKNVGEYQFEIYDNDKNVKYVLENGQSVYIYQIKSKEVEILFNNNEDIEKVYGEAEIDINRVWHYADQKAPINGENLEFTVSRQYNNPNDINDRVNYNVGRYLISVNLDINSEINKNYSIKYNVDKDIYYIISKASIYVKISDTIGNGKDSFIYGNSRGFSEFVSMDNLAYFINPEYPEDVLRKYLPREDIAVDQFESSVNIDIATMALADREKLLDLKLGAGVYDVMFDGGIISANYNVKMIKGKTEIQKRALTVSNTQHLDGYDLLYRQYGEAAINLIFSGFASNDTIVKTGDNYYINSSLNDRFFMPSIIDVTDNALNPKADAGNNIYEIKLKENILDGKKFTSKNYYIDLAEEDLQLFGVKVNKAPLKYSVVNLDTSSLSNITNITKIYGDDLILNTHYKYLFEGFKNGESISELNLRLPSISHAFRAGSLAIIIDYSQWGDQFDNELKNYNLEYVSNNLIIKQAKLKVGMDSTVQFMYNYQLTGVPYKFMYKGDVGDTNVYFNYDLIYEGLKKVDPNNPDLPLDSYLDIFNQVENFAYPKHTVNINNYGTNRKLYGRQLISIEFDNSAIKANGNYEIEPVIGECVINIPIKDVKVSESFKGIGNTFKAEDVLLDIKLNNDEIVKYKLSEIPEYIVGINKGLTFENLQSSYSLNQNYALSIKYAAEFSLPRQEVKKIGENEFIIVKANETFNFNASFGSTLRIYSHNKVVNNVVLSNEGNGNELVNGTKITSIDNTVNYSNNNENNYDTISLSLIMNPTTNKSKFELLLNGNANDNIKLVISRNLYSAGNVYIEINFNGQKGYILLPMTNIDFFDGYLHDIKVYYEKQFNKISVVIDGNRSDSYYLATPDIVYTLNETSIANFNITGLNCYIKDIEYSQRGIYDNNDTQAFGAGMKYDNNVIINNTVIFVDSDKFIEKSYTVSEFFLVVKGYEQKYYLNGKQVETFTFSNTGVYELKTEILDKGTVFDTAIINLTIATMQMGKIDNQNISFVSPYDIYGYEMANNTSDDLVSNGTVKEEIRKVEWDEVGSQNTNKVNVTSQIQKANNGLSIPIYYFDYALITLKTNGDINNAYNKTQSGINSVTVVVRSSGISANGFTTNLYIALGTNTFNIGLGSIDWKNNVIELELFTDYNKTIGDLSMKLNVYSNGVLANSFDINESTNFGGNNLSENQLLELCQLPAKVNFAIKGGKMSIAKVVANEVNIKNNNYLVNNNFVMDLGNGVTVGNSGTLKVASSKGNAILLPSSNIIIELKNDITTSTNANFNLQLLAKNGKKLNFKISKTQIALSFTKDSFVAREQTYNIPTAIQKFNTIRIETVGKKDLQAGSLTSIATTAMAYRIYLNNNLISYEFYAPYYDTTVGWFGTGESSSTTSNIKTFMPYYIEPMLTAIGYGNVVIKRFDARSGVIIW